VLEPGGYFAMNSAAGADRLDAPSRRPNVTPAGAARSRAQGLADIARRSAKSPSLAHRPGAPTAGGRMAKILSSAIGAPRHVVLVSFRDLFEALFILTTIDAGTRVARL